MQLLIRCDTFALRSRISRSPMLTDDLAESVALNQGCRLLASFGWCDRSGIRLSTGVSLLSALLRRILLLLSFFGFRRFVAHGVPLVVRVTIERIDFVQLYHVRHESGPGRPNLQEPLTQHTPPPAGLLACGSADGCWSDGGMTHWQASMDRGGYKTI